jgi:hypothetical protein
MYPSPLLSFRRSAFAPYPTVQYTPSLRKAPFCGERKPGPGSPVPADPDRAMRDSIAIWVL